MAKKMTKKKPAVKSNQSELAQPLPDTLNKIADTIQFSIEELDPHAVDFVEALGATSDLELMAILAFLKIKRPDSTLTLDKMKVIRDKGKEVIGAGHLLVENGDAQKYEDGTRRVASKPSWCWALEKLLFKGQE